MASVHRYGGREAAEGSSGQAQSTAKQQQMGKPAAAHPSHPHHLAGATNGEAHQHAAVEANLFNVIGEIGRLKAIEEELRSRSRTFEDLERLASERDEAREESDHLARELESRDAQLSKLKKERERDSKRIKEMEHLLREKDEVQLKADDSFASAMEELMQKQRLLEIKDRECRERNQAVDLKEKQLQQQVWAREQRMWELEQMVAQLQAQLQKHQEERLQFMEQHQAAAVAAYPPQQTQPQQQTQQQTQPQPQPQQTQQQQTSNWNKDLPLLDKDTLISLIKQFVTPGKKGLTDVDRAHFDKFLLPHSWDRNYYSVYGDLNSFVAAFEARQVVVTPMPAQPTRKKGRGKKLNGERS